MSDSATRSDAPFSILTAPVELLEEWIRAANGNLSRVARDHGVPYRLLYERAGHDDLRPLWQELRPHRPGRRATPKRVKAVELTGARLKRTRPQPPRANERGPTPAPWRDRRLKYPVSRERLRELLLEHRGNLRAVGAAFGGTYYSAYWVVRREGLFDLALALRDQSTPLHRLRLRVASHPEQARAEVLSLITAHQGNVCAIAAALQIVPAHVRQVIEQLHLREETEAWRRRRQEEHGASLRIDQEERRAAMVRALEQSHGHMGAAARLLGMAQSTFSEWKTRLGIEVADPWTQRQKRARRERLVAALADHDGSIARSAAALGISRAKLLQQMTYHQVPRPPRGAPLERRPDGRWLSARPAP